jgi:hypothetical protein
MLRLEISGSFSSAQPWTHMSPLSPQLDWPPGPSSYFIALIFGVAGPSKQAFLRGIGLDHPIDYSCEHLEKKIRELAPQLMELMGLILDPLGGRSLSKRQAGRPGLPCDLHLPKDLAAPSLRKGGTQTPPSIEKFVTRLNCRMKMKIGRGERI